MTDPTRLWNRNYALLWQGQFVSQLGSQAFFIAMAFWIKQETDSATIMGLVMMASQIPAVLLSPIAGAFADRRPRKAIIVVCDLVNGVLTLVLAGVFLLMPERADWHLIVLVVVAVCSASVSAFFRPAITAAIPDIVPRDRLNAANSFNQGSLQIATLLGQSVGGVAYRLLGAPLLFLIDGLTYLFSAVSEMFMKVPFTAPPGAPSSERAWRRVMGEIRDGFSFIWRRPGMRNLLLMVAVINFFSAPYLVLMPFFVQDTLAATADWYGYIVAGFSAGGLIGYAAAGAFAVSGVARSRTLIWSLLAMTLLFGAMGLAPTPWAALLVMFFTGICNGFFNINLVTLFQLTTPTEMRGRVFSLLATVAQGLMPISMGLTGVVTDLLDQDIRLIFVATGAISLLIALAVSANREYRSYLAYQEPEGAGDSASPPSATPGR